jgi:GDP-L-fucose synthase
MFNKILIPGSSGLVDKTVYSKFLEKYSNSKIPYPKRIYLDLRIFESPTIYMINNQPDTVFLCAAKVGEIKANNDFKADFITDNLKIQKNVR